MDDLNLANWIVTAIGSLMIMVAANVCARESAKYSWCWLALGYITSFAPFLGVFVLHAPWRAGGSFYWFFFGTLCFLMAIDRFVTSMRRN